MIKNGFCVIVQAVYIILSEKLQIQKLFLNIWIIDQFLVFIFKKISNNQELLTS